MSTKAYEKRIIRCPACGKGKLINASESVNPSSVRTYTENQYYMADYFIKCPVCKKQVGISIVP